MSRSTSVVPVAVLAALLVTTFGLAPSTSYAGEVQKIERYSEATISIEGMT